MRENEIIQGENVYRSKKGWNWYEVKHIWATAEARIHCCES